MAAGAAGATAGTGCAACAGAGGAAATGGRGTGAAGTGGAGGAGSGALAAGACTAAARAGAGGSEAGTLTGEGTSTSGTETTGGVERAPVRDSLVEARAGLYAQTLRGREALRLIEHDLRQGLARALGGRPLSWDEAARRLAARHPALAGRLVSLRRELQSHGRGAPSSLSDLLPLARRVAQFLQEVR